MPARCPVCDGSDRADVLSLPSMPVFVNAQVRPEDASHVVRGDIDLVACSGCGHLYNRSFDSRLLSYDADYENTLHYSPAFQEYVRPLAERLVAAHDLSGARVAELGSGPGHFLSILCTAGVGEGQGFDPSYDADRLGTPDHPSVSISVEPFPEDGSVPVQLALSQHVLEHLDDPIAALRAQRAAVAATGGTVYTEVPNGSLMLERCRLWDLVYEHFSYFIPASLETACRRAGLSLTATGFGFSEQFLWCDAVAGETDPTARPDDATIATVMSEARSFGLAAKRRIVEAREELVQYAERGPVVLWGAGSKGTTYANLVAGSAPLAGAVDINPRKLGWGIPGTPLVVSSPQDLAALRPRTVLAANPVYVDEITAELARQGVDADVHPI